MVLRTEVLELIQYTPQTPSVRTRPLLMVPPLINKFYIADLAPGRSLVEYLVQGGQQVFMISWRNPDVRHRDWDVNTYGQAILDAVDAALAITGADSGGRAGVLLRRHAGVDAARRPAAARSARRAGGRVRTCGVRPRPGAGRGRGRAARRADREDGGGGVRGPADISTGDVWPSCSRGCGPIDLIWSYWVNNYLQGREPAPFDILFWNADTTRMTAGVHRDFLDLGLRNSLVHPGEARMLGAPVDLSSVAVDGYVVAGVADHISPWQNCYRSAQLFGGRTRFVLSTSGHIAAIVNPPTNRKASYQVAQDLGPRRTSGARTTETTSGSWWPDFLAWLARAQRAGAGRAHRARPWRIPPAGPGSRHVRP